MTLLSGYTTPQLIFIMENMSARICIHFIIKCLISIAFVLYAKSLDSYIFHLYNNVAIVPQIIVIVN